MKDKSDYFFKLRDYFERKFVCLHQQYLFDEFGVPWDLFQSLKTPIHEEIIFDYE